MVKDKYRLIGKGKLIDKDRLKEFVKENRIVDPEDLPTLLGQMQKGINYIARRGDGCASWL